MLEGKRVWVDFNQSLLFGTIERKPVKFIFVDEDLQKDQTIDKDCFDLFIRLDQPFEDKYLSMPLYKDKGVIWDYVNDINQQLNNLPLLELEEPTNA